MLRAACLLAIAALVLLVALFVRPSGATAIAFTFVGHPLMAAALLLGLLWWRRERRRRSDANADLGSEGGAGLGPRPRPRGLG